jgi:integrase
LPGLRYGRCSAPDNPPVSLAPEELIHPVKRYLSRQVAAMVDLQLLTGARPGEITILRPCDVDRSGPVWLFEPYEHKTEHHGHKRVVFLGPKAQQILMPFLLRDHEDYCFSPIEAEEERYDQLERDCYPAGRPNQKRRPNALRRTKRKLGDHYTRDSYRRAITRAQEQAFPLPAPLAKQLRMDGRLENQKEWNARLTDEQKEQVKAWRKKHHWHPHQLRHNYATRVRSQYGLEAAQILLGHAKADVTQVYAERDIAHATNVAARIG